MISFLNKNNLFTKEQFMIAEVAQTDTAHHKKCISTFTKQGIRIENNIE